MARAGLVTFLGPMVCPPSLGGEDWVSLNEPHGLRRGWW